MANALRRSREEFGKGAGERYRRLFGRALRDLAEDPYRPSVRAIDDIREGYVVYHLKWSTRDKRELRVRRPRQLIAFRIDGEGDVIIARVFHERQMLARHLV